MNIIELKFPVEGHLIKDNHGYALYSAIKMHPTILDSGLLANTETAKQTLISSICGEKVGDRKIQLKKYSALRIRCPLTDAHTWQKCLSNRILHIDGSYITVNRPSLYPIASSKFLKTPFLTFNFTEYDRDNLEEKFRKACNSALNSLEIKAEIITLSVPKTITVKSNEIVGYSAILGEFGDQESILIQSVGLGARKHFGCGWLYPCKEMVAQHE